MHANSIESVPPAVTDRGSSPALISPLSTPLPVHVEKLEELPTELLLKIMSHLSPGSLAVCARVSWRLHGIATSPRLW